LRSSRSQSRYPMNALQIRIDNNLPVVAQVHGLQLVELLTPLLHVRNVRPVARQIISRTKMDQDFSTRIGCYYLYVFRVSEIDFKAVRHETHNAGRLDPWNLLKLRFALCQRNKENIASDIAAHDFHDLGLGDVLRAGDFNLVAGVDSEAPRVFAVTVERARH